MATTTTTATVATDRSHLTTRLATAPVVLGVIVLVGAIVRMLASFERTTPRYFPDEFLYPQLARSLGRGEGISVLGEPSTFPALLEPVLTSVIWRNADPELAMRLTQSLHCVAIALAAVPIFAIARQLRLPTGAGLACATIGVVAPGVFFAATLTADAVGYLIALVALAAGLRALTTPTWTTQAWFLGAAGLATFARLQYAVLVPAFVIAALIVDRGRLARVIRAYWLTSMVVSITVLAAIALGPDALGRYELVSTFGASRDAGTWALSTLLLLAIATGVATVPGAIAWCAVQLWRPRDRVQASFAALTASLVGLLVAVAAVMTVETTSDRFLERYLIVVAPLVAVSFACWANGGRPGREVALGVSLVLIIVVARIPLSSYTAGQGVADSPTLLSLSQVERAIGVSTASLAAAGLVTVGLVLAAAAAASTRIRTWLPLGFGVVLLAGMSLVAHASDRATSTTLLRSVFAGSPSWVDAAGGDRPLLVQTPGSSKFDAMLTAFWNQSVERAAPLGSRGIDPVDGLGAPVAIRADGVLTRAGRPLREPVLFAIGGTAAAFSGAEVDFDRRYALVEPVVQVRLAMLANGIRYDGKLTPFGHLAAYPTAAGRCTSLTVRLTVPEGIPATTLELTEDDGTRRRLRIAPGSTARISLTSRADRLRMLRYRTVLLGKRSPSPFVVTVANARYTSRTVRCSA